MNAQSYSRLAAVVFAIVAVLQFVRAVSGWEISLNDVPIPIWASWIACVVALALFWLGYNASRT